MAAANFPPEEFDDEFLTCCVCQSLYSDPRVLPCLHTFCAGCLEQWRIEKSQLTCPSCRHQVSLQETGVFSLPPNFYINKLLDFRALRRSEEAHALCQMCESGARVEGTCGDCRLLLCKNCVTAHTKTQALKDHYIITLDDLKNPRSRQNYTRAEYCPKHTDQRMTFYCQPCAKLVCRDCTITEHRPGSDHDPQEVSKVAQEFKTELQTLKGKALNTAEDLKKTISNVGKELTCITTNCAIEDRKIQEHFSKLRAKIDREEKEMRDKLTMMKETQKEPILKKNEGLKKTLRSLEEGLQSCTNVLGRGNDVEIVTLRRQLRDKLYSAKESVQHQGFKQITFQPNVEMLTCSPGSLSEYITSFAVTEPPVESLPTSIILRPQTQLLRRPQVTVTSPGGQSATLDTTETSEGVFEADWSPETSGEHVVGSCGNCRENCGTSYTKTKASRVVEATWGRGGTTRGVGNLSLCYSLTVDVGSNNPVLKFGQKGSQQGQFNKPVDVAVRGDRLYVADNGNSRVQVFDLSGNFCSSFPTSANPTSVAVQTDGTIMVSCVNKVKNLCPSGELLHEFPLGEYCPNPCGLAVQRNGRVVVADYGKHSIFLFDANGTLVKQVGGQGQGEGQFNKPYFICVDEEDNIIVSDFNNHRVQVFDKNLNFQYKFGQTGRQPQYMWYPTGVSADSEGNIVLANLGDASDVGGVEHGKKLLVFDPDGTFLSTISSDRDKLNWPCGVAVTEDGHVFVADSSHHCIRKYRYM